MYTPDYFFIQHCDAPVQMCQCAEFGVGSSGIHKLGESLEKYGFYPPMVAIGPQSLSCIRPLFGMQP